MDIFLCVSAVFLMAVSAAILFGVTAQKRAAERLQNELAALRSELLSGASSGTAEVFSALTQAQQQAWERQDQHLRDFAGQSTAGQAALQQALTVQLRTMEEHLKAFSLQNEQQLQGIRTTVSTQLAALREDNTAQLEKMRATVDEKLQKTLEERLGRSFATVSSQLEQVYKGLGEMQTLAVGVGDLKRVLTNVKTRGIWGEVQLGAILEQLLTPEQYACNVVTKPGGREPVEFAIRLPGEGSPVWLPIDAKFPLDAYGELVTAAESGDRKTVETASAALLRRLDSFAKDIRDKYVSPPDTTDFAILFLPTEALYAEVVRLGAVETLQRKYRVSIAGPTPMGALLNSLQMGFRTLAIERRSAEVWTLLGAVRTEFDKFGEVLAKARQRLSQADSELERLVGTRTNVIARKLRSVEQLPEQQARELLDDAVSSIDLPGQS